jgi:hypothetical protein
MAPSSTKQWTVEGKGDFEALKFDENASIQEIGDKDVLVKSMLYFKSVDFDHC